MARTKKAETEQAGENVGASAGEHTALTVAIEQLTTVLAQLIRCLTSGVLPAIAAAPGAESLDPPDDEARQTDAVNTRGKGTKKNTPAAAPEEPVAPQEPAEDDTPPARTAGRAGRKATQKPEPTAVEILVPDEGALVQLISQLGSPASPKQAATDAPLLQFDVAIPGTELFLLGDIVVGDSDLSEIELQLSVGQEVEKNGTVVLKTLADIGTYDEWSTPIPFSYDNVDYLAVAPE